MKTNYFIVDTCMTCMNHVCLTSAYDGLHYYYCDADDGLHYYCNADNTFKREYMKKLSAKAREWGDTHWANPDGFCDDFKSWKVGG